MKTKEEQNQERELLLGRVLAHETHFTTAEHIALNIYFGVGNYKPLDVVITHGKGVFLYDNDGNELIDCLSAYSCESEGYSHPRVVEAVQKQAGRCGNISRAFLHDLQGIFMAKLANLCGKDAVLPMNTGVEAVETATKAARKWGLINKGIENPEVIVMIGCFHGRTILATGFSSDEHYRYGFGPFPPGIIRIPYGDNEALRRAITSNTVGILFEPIQGESGIIIPPAGYLTFIRKLCDKKNILMIADEIQTGFGRTGKLFACDHENVVPDIYCLGKPLGGGLVPASAVVANRDILDVFDAGSHGSTFGGYSLACAAGIAAIDVLLDEKLVERSAVLGAYFLGELQKISSSHIVEIRGRGLFIGVELNTPARPFCEALMGEGILCKETHERVIRFAPPLVIEVEQIDVIVQAFKKVLEK